MKIKNILKLLFISSLSLSSFCSFSQTRPALEIYDSTKVCDGYIVWMCELKSTLMDRKGNTLFNFPGNLVSFFNYKKEIVSHSFNNLVVYNKNLDVLWRANTYIHHDIIVTPVDNIIILSDEFSPINNDTLRFDNLLCFDSTGKKIFTWSSFEQHRYLMDFMMKDTSIFRYKINNSSHPDSVLYKIVPSLVAFGKAFQILDDSTLQKRTPPKNTPLVIKKDKLSTQHKPILDQFFLNKLSRKRELFHMNSVQLIPENQSEKNNTAFCKGNILLSFCNFNDSIMSFIAVVDPVKFNILWYYVQEDGRHIHNPSVLPNGNILVYVNWSIDVPYASINEIDPATKKVVWNYTENLPDNQNLALMGSCQRLPNGNTLISNNNGDIYEVTPDKQIVWKYNIYSAGMDIRVNFYSALWYPKEKLNWLINDE